MHKRINESSVVLWLSADDTREWASRPGARWPCSYLAGRRLMCSFDRSGLVDITINGRRDTNCSADEFNAISSDFLATVLSPRHPCWFVCVGQFGKTHPNQVLIDIATRTLDAYHNIGCDAQGDSHDGGLTPEGDFPKLLADMMHLARANGWHFTDMLKQARETFREEVAYETDRH